MAKILIHYGELTLKGRNRHLFERRLAANLKALTGASRIERQHGRLPDGPAGADHVADRLAVGRTAADGGHRPIAAG